MQNGEFPLSGDVPGALCEGLHGYGMKEISWD
jgi:hypothetical protein